MPLTSLLSWIALGFAVGFAATFLPSKLGAVGIPLKLLLGAVGALAAGCLGWMIGAYHSPYAPLGFVFAIAGAVIVLGAYYGIVLRPRIGPIHRADT